MRVMRFLCHPDVARQLEQEALAVTESFAALFPAMTCPDCTKCGLLAHGGCAGLAATDEAYAKVACAMRGTSVTQEPLAQQLQGLLAPPMP